MLCIEVSFVATVLTIFSHMIWKSADWAPPTTTKCLLFRKELSVLTLSEKVHRFPQWSRQLYFNTCVCQRHMRHWSQVFLSPKLWETAQRVGDSTAHVSAAASTISLTTVTLMRSRIQLSQVASEQFTNINYESSLFIATVNKLTLTENNSAVNVWIPGMWIWSSMSSTKLLLSLWMLKLTVMRLLFSGSGGV